LAALKDLRSLAELDLSLCHLMTDNALKYLTQFPALRRLKLFPDITHHGLAHHLRPLKLESLIFAARSNCLDERATILVAELKTLRHLSLSILSDDCLKHLQKLPNLEDLKLNGVARYTVKCVAYFNALHPLKTLDIEFPYSEFMLIYLQGLHQLARLVLRGQPTNFQALSALVKLRELVIQTSGEILEADFQCFGNLVGLRLLDLSKCRKVNVSDVGRSYLARLPNFECLRLPNFTKR